MSDNPRVAVTLASTARYLETVAGLTDDQLRGASLLPGWTRGHVVAHVALNAHGIARALRGLRTGEPAPIYDSREAREADIESHAGGSAEKLAGMTQLACLRLAGELRMVPDDGTVEWAPGGPTRTVDEVVESRWREVEIHHCDLAVGYTPDHWPPGFAEYLLETAAEDRADEVQLTLHARDIGRSVRVGRGGHGVAGTAAALAWWLIGRGDGSDLSPVRPLPELGPWR